MHTEGIRPSSSACNAAGLCSTRQPNAGEHCITSVVDVQDDGLKAIANLEEALKACDKVVESADKQAIPSVQQNALTYVGQIEEAMMKGFPFEVPSQYDNLPQLKASSCPLRVTTSFTCNAPCSAKII